MKKNTLRSRSTATILVLALLASLLMPGFAEGSEIVYTTVNDDDAAVSYSGDWLVYAGHPALYNEDQHYSNEAGAYAEFTFTGTAVELIGATNANLGICDVSIDGVLLGAGIDLYSADEICGQVLFSHAGLTQGEHTLKVTVRGIKNDLAEDCFVTIDAFRYGVADGEEPGPGPDPEPYEEMVNDSDPRISYVGAWSYYENDPSLYEGDQHYSSEAGAYAEFTFTGTSIAFIGATNTNLGTCDIYLDGDKVSEDLDLYSAEVVWQKVLYSKEGLSDREHTIRVVVTGAKNAASDDAYVTLDAFMFDPSDGEDPGPGPGPDPGPDYELINDDDLRITYAGLWSYIDGDAGLYGGDQHYSNVVGAYAELTYMGTSVEWINAVSDNLGLCDIYLDGVKVVEGLDLYAAATDYQRVVFSETDLKYGPHTLRIVATGEKNGASADSYVSIDAFRIGIKPPDVPDFTYTGRYERVDSVHPTTGTERYYIRLLSSGSLTFEDEAVIDIFAVGGGGSGGSTQKSTNWIYSAGGGGGGGYVTNAYGRSANPNEGIYVTVGAGGQASTVAGNAANGLNSNISASAGNRGSNGANVYNGANGGSGGSGGGGGGYSCTTGKTGGAGGAGGTNGSNGRAGESLTSTSYQNGGSGGTGSRAITRPFGGDVAPFSTMTPFAAGGQGGRGKSYASNGTAIGSPGSNGTANTGNGGNGASAGGYSSNTISGGSGGSGIVIIRVGDWSQ